MKRLRFIPCQSGALICAADVTRVDLCGRHAVVPGYDGFPANSDAVDTWLVLAYLRGSFGSLTVGEFRTEEGARLALGRLFRHLNGIPRGDDGDEGGPQ